MKQIWYISIILTPIAPPLFIRIHSVELIDLNTLIAVQYVNKSYRFYKFAPL